MASLKMAAFLLLLAFTASAALEGVSSDRELHPYSPAPEPSPAAKFDERCALDCIEACQGGSRWRRSICLSLCLAQCNLKASDSIPEIVCLVDCAQSLKTDLHDVNKMDDRVSACAQQCKK